MQHTRYECSGGHDQPGCQFCDGGLFACMVCNGFEGSLPTDCPGVPMSRGNADAQADRIYAGTLDYREDRGGWCVPDGAGKSRGDMDVRIKEAKLGKQVE